MKSLESAHLIRLASSQVLHGPVGLAATILASTALEYFRLCFFFFSSAFLMPNFSDYPLAMSAGMLLRFLQRIIFKETSWTCLHSSSQHHLHKKPWPGTSQSLSKSSFFTPRGLLLIIYNNVLTCLLFCFIFDLCSVENYVSQFQLICSDSSLPTLSSLRSPMCDKGAFCIGPSLPFQM